MNSKKKQEDGKKTGWTRKAKGLQINSVALNRNYTFREGSLSVKMEISRVIVRLWDWKG